MADILPRPQCVYGVHYSACESVKYFNENWHNTNVFKQYGMPGIRHIYKQTRMQVQIYACEKTHGFVV